jgi:hypothetical protein
MGERIKLRSDDGSEIWGDSLQDTREPVAACNTSLVLRRQEDSAIVRAICIETDSTSSKTMLQTPRETWGIFLAGKD